MGACQLIRSAGLYFSSPVSTAYPSAPRNTARLRMMVFGAAHRRASRNMRASSAWRNTMGSASRVTGSEARCTQSRTRVVARSVGAG